MWSFAIREDLQHGLSQKIVVRGFGSFTVGPGVDDGDNMLLCVCQVRGCRKWRIAKNKASGLNLATSSIPAFVEEIAFGFG